MPLTVWFWLRVPKKANVELLRSHGAMGFSSTPRFRKRDTFIYYGKKMLKKVSSVKDKMSLSSRKRKAILRKFQMGSENAASYRVSLRKIEPPEEYLQEDVRADQTNLSREVRDFLASLRVFSCLGDKFIKECMTLMEYKHFQPNQLVFQQGQLQEAVYILLSGKLEVFIPERVNSQISLKFVKSGDTVSSFLSVIEAISGKEQILMDVSARACVDSVVIKVPIKCFESFFVENPESLARLIQVVMVRLLRVTFLAMHQHLGLSSELVRNTLAETSEEELHTGLIQSAASQPQEAPQNARRASVFLPNSELATREIADDVSYHSMQFSRFLDPKSSDVLEEVTIKHFLGEAMIMKQDSHKDAALIYVISGSLVVTQAAPGKEDATIFHVRVGEVAGGLAILTGEPSVFTVKTSGPAILATVSRKCFASVAKRNPKVFLYVARTVIARLSPFVRQLDFALDWHLLESGLALFRQGDEADSTFVVLSGRLRSVAAQSDGKKELIGEYGKGDLVGIVEFINESKRNTTVMAVRDTELTSLPHGLLNYIKLKHPSVILRLINVLFRKIAGAQTSFINQSRIEQRPPQCNFTSVAILPASDDVPILQFGYHLYHSLTLIGPPLLLTSQTLNVYLNPETFDGMNDYRLSAWLARQEDQHRIVLYLCDKEMSSWTQTCIRQADCILIVCLADAEPTVGKVEKRLERMAVRTQKELVLLHRESKSGVSMVSPTGTAARLNIRSWCSSHHHLIASQDMFVHPAGNQRKIHLQYRNLLTGAPDPHSDFSRLARWLTGESIGLVLGGGGARGAAHVGIMKALEDTGIPIDMVGGVSIGAFTGALWCMERNSDTVHAIAKKWAMKMIQIWRQLFDLTYPITSMFTGRSFNALIKDVFEDIQIEDLWIPFFAISTDLTSSQMRVHTHGSLWRYVRASMSLSGYMPPLCDPIDGHLLLDGGYVNNLPADVMRKHGAKYILAVDVGSEDETNLTNYGDHLSGWWVLWKKWWPFSAPAKVLNLPDIQSKLAYVSCVRQLEEVKNSDYCEYIRPQIDRYKTLQFGCFDEIFDVGYHHGRVYFSARNKARSLFPESDVTVKQSSNIAVLPDIPIAHAPNYVEELIWCGSSLSSKHEEDLSEEQA
ncbi:neuropathy target esterase sws-like isoform X2 [Artemia franciscana]